MRLPTSKVVLFWVSGRERGKEIVQGKSPIPLGAMLPQVKDHLGPPEAERTRKDPLLEASERAWFC